MDPPPPCLKCMARKLGYHKVNRDFILTFSLGPVIYLNNSAFLFSDSQLNKHDIRLQRLNISTDVQQRKE